MSGQDDRGVSTLVGAILLFGIILVVYATWQAQVVPAENKQIEFKAFQQAGTDLAHLRDAVQHTATTGAASGTVVHTGTDYPARVVFLNPPPASGTLATGSSETVSLQNVKATDPQQRDYWDGTTRSLDTHSINFAPDYNQFHATPMSVQPGGLVVVHGESRSVVETDQFLVSGNHIHVVTVAGDYRDGGTSVSASVYPVSTSTRTISVRNKSPNSNIIVSVPTTLGNDTWRHDVLHDQIHRKSTNPQGRVDSVAVKHGDAIITLRRGVYQLSLSRVRLGEPASSTSYSLPARYLTTPNPNPGPSYNGTPVRIETTVRDRYGNPNSTGVKVKFSDSSTPLGDPKGGSCSAVGNNWKSGSLAVQSDADGHAVACVKPGTVSEKQGSRTIQVTATIPKSSALSATTKQRTVPFNVTVAAS